MRLLSLAAIFLMLKNRKISVARWNPFASLKPKQLLKKTKTKAISNHNRNEQRDEPITIPTNQM